jgi:energy-coupling factor transporter ATP-binding protein EcfA2
MIKSLHIENFTVFSKADLDFGRSLNVIVGENGSGKSHLLKVIYGAIAVIASRSKDGGADVLGKAPLQAALAEKLQGVFRPDGLWRLVRRRVGRSKCLLDYRFGDSDLDLKFTFSTVARTEVTLAKTPKKRVEKLPVFLPTRELLTIYPNFVSLYETTHLPFEETWRDTCILLGAPLVRGPRMAAIKQMLIPLEEAMGGEVELDKTGAFYLNLPSGSMEISLVAEGLRKLAMIARLIATGSLLDKGYLFWDEPEANLNPKVIKTVARTILQIASSGIQVFIASHSLFLLRELHILQQSEFKTLDSRYFGLHLAAEGSVEVKQGKTMDDIGEIAALDEELQQSDRYLETEAERSGAEESAD